MNSHGNCFGQTRSSGDGGDRQFFVNVLSGSRMIKCVVRGILIVSVGISAGYGQTPDEHEANTLADALAPLGVPLDGIRIRAIDLDRLTNRSRRGSVVSFLLAEPLQAKTYMQQVRDGLSASLARPVEVPLTSPFWQGIDGVPESQTWAGGADGVARCLAGLSRWGDRVVRRSLLGNPVSGDLKTAAKPGALAASIAALHERAGQPLDASKIARLTQSAETLPVAHARAAALLLSVAGRAIDARDLAFRHLDESVWTDKSLLAGALSLENPDAAASFRDRLAAFEPGHLYAAAQELSVAAHLAARLLAMTAPRGAFFEWETPYGMIAIDGTGATTYRADRTYLLILDTVGNDTYRGGGGALGWHNPVSILIDVRGNDTYVAVGMREGESPSQRQAAEEAEEDKASATPCDEDAVCSFGAGFLGVGLLLDVEGDDAYRAARFSMGSGVFGVGLLDDWSGNDTYTATSRAQGSAIAGAGLLVDRDGHDRYEAYTLSQACASVDGVAALVDLTGNDRYTANDSDIRFPSSQSAEHNDSLSQGVGVGHRADYLHGYSLPGGVAVLYDGGGDDTYTCGVFGQGAGYWLGVGMLIDAAGNDSYLGQWYVQGAAAHFAVGALLDEAGDDSYHAGMATSQGTGHDLSLGFLADLGGNDTYRAAGLTMGSGNAAGIGIVVDAAGDDRYEIAPNSTLGYANVPTGLRASMITLGLFLDAGGKDTYSQPYAADGGRWSIGPDRSLAPPTASSHALGIDAALTSHQLENLWRRRK